MTVKQLAIAFGKYISGYRPGGEGWSNEDEEAYSYVMEPKSKKNKIHTRGPYFISPLIKNNQMLCYKCGEIKNRKDFPLKGLKCKECVNKHIREYHAMHKDRELTVKTFNRMGIQIKQVPKDLQDTTIQLYSLKREIKKAKEAING